jgi:spermidine synthase
MNVKNIIILAAFALSGVAALIYEVVWFRSLQLIFGSTVYAVSTMLTAFMAGLALGSWLMAKYTDKLKNPLFIFAVIEVLIGLYGLTIISIFNWLPFPYIAIWKAFHPSFEIFSLVQFLLAFLVLLIPTALMGATWPVVNKVYVKHIDSLGKSAGILYSVNSFGAILGSFSAGFILIPILGIKNSSIFAAILNLIAAILIFYLSRREKIEE